MSKSRAYFYVIAGASLWGLIGLFVKLLAAEGFTSMQIVALRALAAAVFITPVLRYGGGGRVAARDLWLFFGTGVVSLTFFNYCYFNCIEASSLAVAALLLYTAPTFVMLLSLLLFKERFTLPKLAALAAAFAGCGLVTGAFGGRLELSFSGILYGLGSGIGYALYSIFGKLALRRYSSLTITAYTFYFALASSLLLAGFSGADLGRLLSWRVLGGALGLGVLCAVAPYLLYTKGLSGIDAGRASVLATVEPFVAAAVGAAVFAEPMTSAKAAGMLLILASIVGLELAERK